MQKTQLDLYNVYNICSINISTICSINVLCISTIISINIFCISTITSINIFYISIVTKYSNQPGDCFDGYDWNLMVEGKDKTRVKMEKQKKLHLKSENWIFCVTIDLVLVHVASFLTRVRDRTTQHAGSQLGITNRHFGRMDHYDGHERNSGTKLIFRKIWERFWLMLVNSGTKLIIHSNSIEVIFLMTHVIMIEIWYDPKHYHQIKNFGLNKILGKIVFFLRMDFAFGVTMVPNSR